MSFKDLIPWRSSHHDLPVQRLEQAGQPAWPPGDDLGLAPFFRQTQDLFDRFFQGFGLPWPSGGGLWEGQERNHGPALQLDMTETEEAFHVSVELPGVDDDDIDVSISPGMLIIRGEKRSERDETKSDVYRRERYYGRFERTVPLPAQVEEDKVKAEFRRGVLNVTLPKSPATRQRTRKIPVRVDGK